MYVVREISAAFLLLSVAVNAYLIAPSAPTEASANILDGNGWSPKPTQAPFGQALGAIDERQLFGRDVSVSQTCGYINGIASLSLTCGAGSGCAYINSVAYGPVCCGTNTAGSITGDCPGATVCEPYHNTIGTYNGSQIVTTELAVWCPSATPICFTWLYNEVVGGGSTRLYSVYDCTGTGVATISEALVSTNPGTTTTTSNSPTVVSATTQLSSPTSALSPTTLSPTTAQSTVIISSPSPSPTSASPVSTTPATVSPIASSTSTSTPVPQPSHTGAIAGGVVGGVAAIGLVVGTILYLMRRKRLQRKEVLPEISQYAAR